MDGNMQILLITDTHAGVRGDSEFFNRNSSKFYKNILFKYIDDFDIKTIIHLGDLVDRRKYINFLTLNELRKNFLDEIAERNLDAYFIAGNHDCAYKNTNKINALREIIQDKYQFSIIDNVPVEITFDGLNILLVPWICEDNQDIVFTSMNVSQAQICMGHFEIEKFPMYKGLPSEHGLHIDTFKKFDMVMSGHYHTRSHARNIWYLGSHAEFTWSDYNDPRGFHIFDTSTRELTFIENPYTVFKKLFYDDKKELPVITDELSTSIIKVVIQSKEDPYKFDKFISAIEAKNPIELQIVEDHLNLHLEDDNDVIDEAESTLDIFRKYISKLEISQSMKEPLDNLIVELYNEAISLEETWQ